jgi:hypothetical protein
MNINPGVVATQDILPSAEDLAALGLLNGWVRILVVDVERFDRALAAAGWPDTVRACVLLEGQTQGIGGDFAGWVTVVKEFARRFKGRVQAVECANELDIWHWQPPGWNPERPNEGPSRPNPLLTPQFAAKLVRDAAPHLRAANMKVIAPAVASGRWFDYLRDMTAELGNAADYQAFHPYGKKIDNHPPHAEWGELAETIAQAREIAGRPLALTELGVKVGEAGGPEGQAEYVRRLFGLMAQQPPGAVGLFCYFAWKDGIEIPGEGAFGLVEASGRWREACRTFQRACGGPHELPREPVAPGVFRFQMGFKAWADREPELLGTPLEEELSPFPGLALQRTDRGLLLWTNVDGGVHLFHDFRTNARRVWREGWPASQPVMT